MTEYLLNDYTGQYDGDPRWGGFTEEQKWDQSIEMLTSVHVAMESNWNAYIWWYLKRYYSFIGEGQQGSTNGEILKRGYAFSHFSKFIRPGYERVDAVHPRLTDLSVTAYEGDDKVVVEVLNSTSSSKSYRVVVPGINISDADVYTTSLNTNRKGAEFEIKNGGVEMRVVAKSITTVILDK